MITLPRGGPRTGAHIEAIHSSISVLRRGSGADKILVAVAVITMSSSIRTPMPRSSTGTSSSSGLEVQPRLHGDHHARLQRALPVELPPGLGAVVHVEAEVVRGAVHHPAPVLAAVLGRATPPG